MSLTNTKIKSQGFTIVELLIVVVVIAILAAITIVSYNGITNRANASAAASAAESVQKKAEAFNAETSHYPAWSDITTGSSANSYYLGTSITNGTPTSSNGKNTVQYTPCGTAGSYTGATIATFNYNAGSGTNTVTVGTGC